MTSYDQNGAKNFAKFTLIGLRLYPLILTFASFTEYET